MTRIAGHGCRRDSTGAEHPRRRSESAAAARRHEGTGLQSSQHMCSVRTARREGCAALHGVQMPSLHHGLHAASCVPRQIASLHPVPTCLQHGRRVSTIQGPCEHHVGHGAGRGGRGTSGVTAPWRPNASPNAGVTMVTTRTARHGEHGGHGMSP